MQQNLHQATFEVRDFYVFSGDNEVSCNYENCVDWMWHVFKVVFQHITSHSASETSMMYTLNLESSFANVCDTRPIPVR